MDLTVVHLSGFRCAYALPLQFEMRIPARKFSSYVCVGRAALEAIARKNTAQENISHTEEKREKEGVTEEVELVD